MKTAVLVIDVQQGLCVGAQAAHDCAGTIDRINSVTRRARATLADEEVEARVREFLGDGEVVTTQHYIAER